MMNFTRRLERKNLEEEEKRILLENERKAREDENLMSLEECRQFWAERFEAQNRQHS